MLIEDRWEPHWQAAFHAWLALLRLEKTRRDYRRIWELFIAYFGKPPHLIQPADVAAWGEFLMEEQYAQSTIRSYLTAIRSFYQEALRIGLVASNPVGSKTGTVMYPGGRYLSEEEEAALLGAIDRDTTWGRRDYALILFLLRSGRRLAEVLDLRWGDFEVGKAGVWYRWRKPKHPSRSPPGEPRSAGPGTPPTEEHRARLDWEVWAAICMHLAGCGRLINIQPGDVIFARLSDVNGWLQRRFGEAWNQSPPVEGCWRLQLHVYADWAELPQGAVTPKTLRYTGAVRKWNAEHDLPALQEFLGHSAPRVTRSWVREVVG